MLGAHAGDQVERGGDDERRVADGADDGVVPGQCALDLVRLVGEGAFDDRR
nr:hypothetical protein [Nonomuraea typhae]